MTSLPKLRTAALQLVMRAPRHTAPALLAILAVFLVSVGALVWFAARAIETSALEATSAARLNDGYLTVRGDAAQEELLASEYIQSPRPALLASHQAAAVDLQKELANAGAHGDASDRSAVAELRTEHAEYLSVAGRLFAAVDAGDLSGARSIYATELAPVADDIQQTVDVKVTEVDPLAESRLARLDRVVSRLATTAPLLLALCLLLVLGLRGLTAAASLGREAKARFFAYVTHELRTPLNAILGFSELLQSDPAQLNDKQRRYLANIETAGRQLLELVGEVLDLSKAEAGKMDFRLEEFTLADLLSDSVEQVAVLAETRSMTIRIDSPTPGPAVRADRQRLRQVLLNGLSNAVKYGLTGGHVTVKAWAAGRSVIVEVVDDGPGMSPAELASAKREYVRGGEEVGRSETGTGLGLPLSKLLAEGMGGRLELESELGTGTTYRVRIPLAGVARAPAIAA